MIFFHKCFFTKYFLTLTIVFAISMENIETNVNTNSEVVAMSAYLFTENIEPITAAKMSIVMIMAILWLNFLTLTCFTDNANGQKYTAPIIELAIVPAINAP